MELCKATKIIEFDMAHRIPNHKSKCKHLHGHRYRVEATIQGPIIDDDGQSDAGMVIDFGDIKKILTEHIHDCFDHGAMFYVFDEVIQETCHLLKTREPLQNINMVDFIPTAENLAKYFFEIVKKQLSSSMILSRIRVYETPNSWADYEGTK